MSDLQKRFNKQRDALLKTVPKDSRLVDPIGSLKLPKSWIVEENAQAEKDKKS